MNARTGNRFSIQDKNFKELSSDFGLPGVVSPCSATF
jgi:hypothetical protein